MTLIIDDVEYYFIDDYTYIDDYENMYTIINNIEHENIIKKYIKDHLYDIKTETLCNYSLKDSYKRIIRKIFMYENNIDDINLILSDLVDIDELSNDLYQHKYLDVILLIFGEFMDNKKINEYHIYRMK